MLCYLLMAQFIAKAIKYEEIENIYPSTIVSNEINPFLTKKYLYSQKQSPRDVL